MSSFVDTRSQNESGQDGNVVTLSQKRTAALSDVDNAPLSWFHRKVIIVAGSGFFTDAYNIFAIGISATLLGLSYGTRCQAFFSVTGNGETVALLPSLDPEKDLLLKISSPLGNLIGLLLFGWLADHLGRKRMYALELAMITLTTFFQALIGFSRSEKVIDALIFLRVLMGIGVGGDYPVSAIIASEFAPIRFRGRIMTHVFAAQGWGNLLASVVGLISVQIFSDGLKLDSEKSFDSVRGMWQLIIGIGCFPGAISLYFRTTIPETPRFTMDIEANLKKAEKEVEMFVKKEQNPIDPDPVVQEHIEVPKASLYDFFEYFGKKENYIFLLGTCLSWFMQDVAFYGLGLNQNVFLAVINPGPFGNACPVPISIGSTRNSTGVFCDVSSLPGFSNSNTAIRVSGPLVLRGFLTSVSVDSIVISVAGLIPGYYTAYYFIDKIGRLPLQFFGFAVLAVLFIIMSLSYEVAFGSGAASGRAGWFFLYILANFVQNLGPNTTTFIIPGEAFTTRYRSTAHGISGAAGRLGAIIAQLCLYFILQGRTKCSLDLFSKVWEGIALFMFFGFLSTFLLTETKHRSLESLSNERQGRFAAGDTGENSDDHELDNLMRNFESQATDRASFPDDDHIQEIGGIFHPENGGEIKAKQRYQRGYAEVHTDFV